MQYAFLHDLGAWGEGRASHIEGAVLGARHRGRSEQTVNERQRAESFAERVEPRRDGGFAAVEVDSPVCVDALVAALIESSRLANRPPN